MSKSIFGTKKYIGMRGRPATTGSGVQIGMRWHQHQIKAIDDWRREQSDIPSRAQAIRRLVELGLKAGKGR